MSEEWRVIPQFPCYSASSFGRVMRNCDGRPARKGRILLGSDVGKYRRFTAYGSGKVRSVLFHIAVCSAFHGPKPSKNHQVRHLDGDPKNNIPENLAWGTAKENAADRDLHGRTSRGPRKDTSNFARGERNNGGSKLTDDKVRAIFSDKRSRRKIAKEYGVSSTLIGYIHTRQNWCHVTNNMER